MTSAILLDIDGTLTNDMKQISPRTREALLAAQARGIRLVLASGRTPMGLTRFAEELKMPAHDGVLICYNGGHVELASTGEVLFDQKLTVAQARSVLERVRDYDVLPILYRDPYLLVHDAFAGVLGPEVRPAGYDSVIEYEARSNGYLLQEVADFVEYVDWEPNKVLVTATPSYLDAVGEEMAAPFAGQLNHMYSTPYFFEFTPLGVDKGHAMVASFPKLGLDPADAIAFGDARNDITMLEWAGTGVAMGNADDETKAAADFVTRTNDEDGIAWALERLL